MPGLIDSHTHLNLSMDGGRPGMEMARWDYMAAHAASAALEWFYDGFTTVRDMGGRRLAAVRFFFGMNRGSLPATKVR